MVTAEAAKKRVWVTRPADQAGELGRLISKQGLQLIRFPVIEIQILAGCAELEKLFSRIADYRLLIFVSQNAVSAAFHHYLDKLTLPADLRFVAIGKSTAAALQGFGVKQVLHAGTVADSEALLAMPELQAEQVGNCKILLVRGHGGRDVLYKTLQERGASVDIAEVYLRNIPQYDKNDSDKLWQQSTPDAIIVTSNEGIDNLISLTPEMHKVTLFQTALIVMSERNAEFARERGFTGDIAVAKDKNDTGLINATTELLETSHS